VTVTANVQTRVLTPTRLLLGPGSPDSLENVGVRELPDGAQCYVLDPAAGPFGALYVLRRNSTDPVSPPNVIATSYGAAVPGRWFRQNASGGAGTVLVADQGVPLGAASVLDFVGPGVSTALALGTATVTIPGGGSTSGATAAVEAVVTFNGGAVQNVGAPLPAGAIVVESKVRVVQPWDQPAATVLVGIGASPSLLLDAAEVNPSVADIYYDENLEVLAGSEQLIASVSSAGSVQGSARVVVEYIVP
jgi:hypothetical protein